MTRVAIVNTEGEVVHLWNSGAQVEPEGEWSTDKTKTVVHLNTNIDASYFMSRNYYKGGTWKERAERPGDYYNWKDEAWVLDSTALFKQLRLERNSRLYSCDWTQASDSPLSTSKKAEWAEYREALRSVPANNSGVSNLASVVWPDKPS